MKAEQLTDVCTYLDELYITTSRENLRPGADPQAGAVFHTTPGVRGLPLGTFAG
jgi:sugar lactone lactonase YvrE